jgi:hypothetical protein
MITPAGKALYQMLGVFVEFERSIKFITLPILWPTADRDPSELNNISRALGL